MNAPILPASIIARRKVRVFNIERMKLKAIDWAKHPHDDYYQLAFLDALSFCIESDLADEMDAVRHDMRIDEEGFPLNDDGYPIAGAEREYIPLNSLKPVDPEYPGDLQGMDTVVPARSM